ncbi:Uncharacterized protein TPAR_00909 [Tolypocladium paradoxum]|uniref:Uncharacterized protein n=1 Tax=Tolypocladium paradoxum TaxID=94208 RepID=A0A2S4L8Z7_9HYPO|nr:Uncharacterized protein TPAR_00909 [Tolypocladium paradoxum]
MANASVSFSVTAAEQRKSTVISYSIEQDQAEPEAKMPAPTYIISRVADPIFAVVIGVSAAATRINREEKTKGRTTNETIEAGLRRIGFPKKTA